MKDAFGTWWVWANKPENSHLAIDVAIWRPISRMSPEDRLDRQKVNDAVARHKEPEANSPPCLGALLRSSVLISFL